MSLSGRPSERIKEYVVPVELKVMAQSQEEADAFVEQLLSVLKGSTTDELGGEVSQPDGEM